MKFLLIPDKFKGSLTAKEVINAVTNGLELALPTAEIKTILASDGGDGFLDAILAYANCNVIKIAVVDPLGRDLEAEYLYDAKEQTAYIELAKASGLTLLKEEERDVMQTSTLGTGLLIKDAIEKGCTSIYIGLGGSATNDAGLGIAEALGYYFLDGDGNQLTTIGSNLSEVKSIHKRSNSISLKGISFFAVNDVDNPLFGIGGAAQTYGAQKGASVEQIIALDYGMQDFANVVQLQTGKDIVNEAGAGAAGGTAYGLKVFCEAEFISGIDFVLGLSKASELLAKNKFDYIITGEGKFDSQTLHGKLIKGVIDLGKKHEVPVLAICGQLDLEKIILEKIHQLFVVEIRDTSKSLQYNMENAGILIEKSVELFFRKK